MKTVAFIGYTEKVDLIASLAKTIQIMNKTVLVIDATLEKKYKYIIPSIETPDKAYLTQYDYVDYAVGFDSYNDLENYMCDEKINISLYDYILIDIDNTKTYEFFRNKSFDKCYFISDTSLLSYKKNVEILDAIKVYNTDSSTMKMKKIIYRAYLTRASDKYFTEKYADLDFNWDIDEMEIMEDEQDRMIALDFYISGMLQLKKHTRDFINSVATLANEIIPEIDLFTIRRAMKKGGM